MRCLPLGLLVFRRTLFVIGSVAVPSYAVCLRICVYRSLGVPYYAVCLWISWCSIIRCLSVGVPSSVCL